MALTALYATIAFVLIMGVLVGMLVYAKAKLVPAGEVNVVINNDEEHPLKINPGGTLLNALSEKSVFLPSACGGGGTCAMCKCQVLDGGGDILPTEVGYFTRSEIKDQWRLSCQVKVREDLKIKVPDEIFGIKKWECEVVSNHGVATFIKELVVKLPEGQSLEFQSGGYIQIDVPEGEVDFSSFDVEDRFREDWDKFQMWDLSMVSDEDVYRAYSMANHPEEGDMIKLNIRIATPPWDKNKNRFMQVNPGICSSYTFALKPGDKVMVSGPYGDFFIKDTEKEMVYIGGGAGMAPLRSHIFHLFHTLKTGRKVSYWYGGRSLQELFYTEQYREIEKNFPNFTYNVALSEPQSEDNWDGYTGFIHQVVLDNYLSKHPEPEEIEYYFCGPPMMNEAVIKMLDDLGVPDENVSFDDFGI